MVVERTAFGTRLRNELNRQDISARELARRLRPDDPEGARRSVARWLAPRDRAVVPGKAKVAQIAAALGVDPSALSADDDEESDPVADLLRALRRVVRDDARAIIRAELQAGKA
jgi:transcriptional regulator with XRE-family HTH domain